jgi:hypothetical protein
MNALTNDNTPLKQYEKHDTHNAHNRQSLKSSGQSLITGRRSTGAAGGVMGPPPLEGPLCWRGEAIGAACPPPASRNKEKEKVHTGAELGFKYGGQLF